MQKNVLDAKAIKPFVWPKETISNPRQVVAILLDMAAEARTDGSYDHARKLLDFSRQARVGEIVINRSTMIF